MTSKDFIKKIRLNYFTYYHNLNCYLFKFERKINYYFKSNNTVRLIINKINFRF